MTMLIIFLLSCLSTYLMLKLIAILLDTTLNDLLTSDNSEDYTTQQTLLAIMMNLLFFITFIAINNTFFHYKY